MTNRPTWDETFMEAWEQAQPLLQKIGLKLRK